MMTKGVRSAITITVLGLLVAGAAIWGWSAATEPLPDKADPPLCEGRHIDSGTKVFPQDVTVSVFNAGTREGLAGRTMQLLTDRGFAAGSDGNVTTKRPVHNVQIWTSDPHNVAVRLVASRFPANLRIVRRDPPGVGVVVVVGDDFTRPVKGKRSMVARDDTEICSPPVS
jgi:hypothetical protein